MLASVFSFWWGCWGSEGSKTALVSCPFTNQQKSFTDWLWSLGVFAVQGYLANTEQPHARIQTGSVWRCKRAALSYQTLKCSPTPFHLTISPLQNRCAWSLVHCLLWRPWSYADLQTAKSPQKAAPTGHASQHPMGWPAIVYTKQWKMKDIPFCACIVCMLTAMVHDLDSTALQPRCTYMSEKQWACWCEDWVMLHLVPTIRGTRRLQVVSNQHQDRYKANVVLSVSYSILSCSDT